MLAEFAEMDLRFSFQHPTVSRSDLKIRLMAFHAKTLTLLQLPEPLPPLYWELHLSPNPNDSASPTPTTREAPSEPCPCIVQFRIQILCGQNWWHIYLCHNWNNTWKNELYLLHWGTFIHIKCKFSKSRKAIQRSCILTNMIIINTG